MATTHRSQVTSLSEGLVSQTPLASYTYDNRGNMLTEAITGGATTTYTWDARDRMTAVDLPGGATNELTYVYDAEGRRARQTLSGTITKYLWDERSMYGDVVAELNASNAVNVSYVLGPNGLISQRRGATTNYYLADAQNSTRLLTNTSAGVTDTYRYNAFGDIETQTGTTTNSYLYTGQQFDSSTGLYSLRARYYDAAIGRFLSRDTYPVNHQNPMELNRYVYAAGNPVRYADPSGHSFEFGSILKKITGTAATVVTTFGEKVRDFGIQVQVWINQIMPWVRNALCIGIGLATDANIDSACDFLPPVILPNPIRPNDLFGPFLVGPGNPIYDAVAFVRYVAESIYKIIRSPGQKNFAVARYALDGVEHFLWGVSGDGIITQRLETMLRNIGQQIAEVPNSYFFNWEFLESGRPAHLDSEIKILEQIARQVMSSGENVVRFTVDLYTERFPCPSCGGDNGLGGVIEQFAQFMLERGIDVTVNVFYSVTDGTLPQGVPLPPIGP